MPRIQQRSFFHELRHTYDGAPLGISEFTNNLYFVMMQDKYSDESRLKKSNI